MTEASWFPQWLSRALNLFGIAVVSFYTIRQYVVAELVAWGLLASLIALAAWLLRVAVPRSWQRVHLLALIVMLAVGSLAAAPSSSLAIVPAVVGLMQIVRSPRISMGHAIALGMLALLAASLGAALVAMPTLGVIAIAAGLVVAFLVGLNRRQYLAAEVHAQELRESAMAMREEQSRALILESREAVARDIHDLLAHSLGGLVIQLDAVAALLEADDVAAATARALDARQLAADGLSEARRAVAALRDERVAEVPAEPAAFVGGLLALAEAHRSLGGEVDVIEHGNRVVITGALADAMHRAFRNPSPMRASTPSPSASPHT